MRTTRLLLGSGILLLGLWQVPLFAQEEQAAPPAGKIYVEQRSNIDALGVWTVLQPNHESFHRSDKSLEIPNLTPGQYSIFVNAPMGTATKIDVHLGDEVTVSSDTPQITFTLRDKETLNITITYTLTIYGKIGVSSDPVGVPFELKGPDNLVRMGVTPEEYLQMPIGNYSVQYKPQGCDQPSAKSTKLEKSGSAYFMIEIVCKDFRPVTEKKAETVSADIGNQTIVFTDVPTDAWFAPYVMTIAKRGIMSGYTNFDGSLNGIFGAGDPVTIAQLAKIAHETIKLDENTVTAFPINPNAQRGWFKNYIASAEEQGWVVFVDGTVDPNRPATRGEVLMTLLQIFDIPMQWTKGTRFTDVPKKTPYASAIETAAAEGIVSGSANADGTPTGLFHPNDPITRAEMAKILIQVHEKYQQESSSSSEN